MQAAMSMNAYQNSANTAGDPYHSSYQENQVYTASREELILMLYEGALKFIRFGLLAIEEQNGPQIGFNILRAQKIIHYLDMCLNMEAGKEIAENLSRLYYYINQKLFEGQQKKEDGPLKEAAKVIETLKDAWKTGVVDKAEV